MLLTKEHLLIIKAAKDLLASAGLDATSIQAYDAAIQAKQEATDSIGARTEAVCLMHGMVDFKINQIARQEEIYADAIKMLHLMR